MSLQRQRVLVAALVGLTAGALAPSCTCDSGASGGQGGAGANSGGGAGGGGAGANSSGGGGGLQLDTGPTCQNLECQQVTCGAGGSTTVSGTVFAPEGSLPLYNVVVYVPNAPLDPISDGASCEQCGQVSGSPLVSAITDTHGNFVLENVPAGADIPLVLQVGKWRRELTLPSVSACTDNPTISGELRLPRNQLEGHIPRIALTTGGADPLECLLRKVGVDDAEFTAAGGAGRVHLFAGSGGTSAFSAALGGGAFAPATDLWGTEQSLLAYDVVLLACEAGTHPETKPQTSLDAMQAYTSKGGRVFASHWHNYWVESGPAPFPGTAVWNHQPDPASPFQAFVDTTFPKGAALADWLLNVGASPALGELEINGAQHTIDTVTMLSRRWIYGQNPDSVQYLTFNTPLLVPEEMQCGRLVLSDIHVSSGDVVGQAFPDGCVTQDLSPQEKALLFMLFDLSSCIVPDDQEPNPPS